MPEAVISPSVVSPIDTTGEAVMPITTSVNESTREAIANPPTQTNEIDDTIDGDEVPIPPHGEIDSDEPPLESYVHLQQIILLLTCLEWHWRDRQDFFAAGNLTIYYSINRRRSEDFRGPDFFLVLDTTRRPRKSWVVWEEDGKYPHVIIEILSEATARVDRGLKKEIYQNTFRTPNYFWFDPRNLEFAGFHLVAGEYQPIIPNPQGYLWSEPMGLYVGIYQQQLRFFTLEGDLVPTPPEVATQSLQQANEAIQQAADTRQWAEAAVQQAEDTRQQVETELQQARQQANQAIQQAQLEAERAEKLAAKLREWNLNPEDFC